MKLKYQNNEKFHDRQIGIEQKDLENMLETVGCKSLDDLIGETIPKNIRLKKSLNLPEAIQEHEYIEEIRMIASKNKMFKSFIGLGYYDCITPSVIQRNIFENPGWYTQYTPYQAEISQGRLEALLNFQTMVSDLTGMEIANASLLDEATAAAEAMTMLYRLRNSEKVKNNANEFIVCENCFPQTIDVLKTRAEPLGIQLKFKSFGNLIFNDKTYGIFLQFPAEDGGVYDYQEFINKAHENGSFVAVAADLMSLLLLTPPGEFGADVVLGSSQRFGVPMGYGGPHAAYFATRNEFKRQVPGRIIGTSVDRYGNLAYRMALQTREQHIRREKATSNICTAQALLAIMASMYTVYHGPKKIKKIAERIHALARILNAELKKMGYTQLNNYFFDTLKIKVSKNLSEKIKIQAISARINFRFIDHEHIGVSLDERTTLEDIKNILSIFAQAKGKSHIQPDFKNYHGGVESDFPENLLRKSEYLTHPVFHKHHSETKMMRYIKILEKKDLSLTTSMIPLGSCTMKLNPATAMMPVSWPEFGGLHPFVPIDQAKGYQQIIQELEERLCEITGLTACSLQPNSGAQGEYTGLSIIRAYHKSQGEDRRDVTFIPESAHGTNPASAIMAGTKVVIIKCEDNGDIDINDLKARAKEYSDSLAALMVTYPSTHGVFEEKIQEICDVIHQYGGQVYMDGANMNAQVGFTSPGVIGADVCHLNLHKTFSIPHGGGGPGMGPICTAKHLAPFLPGHPLIKTGGSKAITAVSATPWGSASILLISHAYIKMLGTKGLEEVTKYAILNANYVKSKLEKYYPVLYSGNKGRVAHELIFDLRSFKKDSDVEVDDIAKRLMDYGFHAPTTSWPVLGTIMFEPTESESKEELDRFCNAMLSIYEEIQEISEGKADALDNVLKNAPHTAEEIAEKNWSHLYSREKAVFPIEHMKKNKFWLPVGRIDNTYGDRNLFCTCPPIEAYTEKKKES